MVWVVNLFVSSG